MAQNLRDCEKYVSLPSWSGTIHFSNESNTVPGLYLAFQKVSINS